MQRSACDSESSSEKSESELANIRNIELLTDANVVLKLRSDLDLSHTRQFLHTPKEGWNPAENTDFFLQHYKENEFLQNFMKSIDARMDRWSKEQTPRV